MTARTPTVGARRARPNGPPSQLEGSERAPRRGHDADRLTRTSAALAINTIVTSALGLAFWLVASHRYSARQVGTDSALLSAMLLLSSLTELNLTTALPRLLPQIRRRRRRAVALCYLATATAGAVGAAAFALVVPHLVPRLRFLLHSDGLILALIVGLVVFNVFSVQDAVLVACRRAAVVPVKNALYGVMKLVVMVLVVGHLAGHGIFVSWLVAALVLVFPVNALLFGRVLREPPLTRGEQSLLPIEDRRNLVRYLAYDWAANLLGQGTADLLPLIVLAVLGSAVAGYFYIAFIVATAAATFSQSFSTSLLVEAAHDESALDRLTHRTIIRCAVVIVPGILVAVGVAPFALRLFGAQYAVHAGQVLRLLLLATIPQTAVAIALSVERIRGRADRVLRYRAITAVSALALVVPLIHVAGLPGVGWAWLGAQGITALFVVPTLRSVLGSRRRWGSFEGTT